MLRPYRPKICGSSLIRFQLVPELPESESSWRSLSDFLPGISFCKARAIQGVNPINNATPNTLNISYEILI